MMTTNEQSTTELLIAAKKASRVLAASSGEIRAAAIRAIADAVDAGHEEILAANALDVEAGKVSGLDDALIDRLTLTPDRIRGIAEGARAVADLEDPVDEELEGHRLDNGLEIRKVRRPLGVVAVVYEARPNVTIDSAVLCLRSANAAVLRGSSTAAHSNAVLARLASAAITASGLPAAAVTLIGGGRREELQELGTATDLVDLIIPRGGAGLKKALEAVATVPVIYAAAGNCHVYVDAEADLAMAQAIIVNAKVQRPGVCNAAETLLVHESVAAEFLPTALAALAAEGVELRCDGRAAALAGSGVEVVSATDEDFATEFLAPILSIAVVDSADAAIAHIGRFGSGHSEAVVTSDRDVARRFQAEVDAACVYVNASTRFTDGAEFGMGAEIGISTQKLHARGPIGLRELTTFTYLIDGDGQIRG
ncbi:MAG: glutamate-5-semialdehyde dehydrogenase [Actinomycetes bacterium]